MPKPKLLLVNPVNHKRIGYFSLPSERHAPLNLLYIASLTPADWDIKIADENFGPMQYEEADLVGITSLTATVNRAYEIAGEYRKKGIPVVIGGMHACLLPDEVARFADTVVSGDAEDTWPQVVADFSAGRLQPRYQGAKPAGVLQVPKNLRRELLHPGYSATTVETSRGCPMRCDFCAVDSVYHGSYRLRPVEDVLDEIAATDKKMIYFVDDNIVGYGPESENRARRLFQGMIDRKLNKHWFAAASMNLATNDSLLALARKSGCRMVALGVETEDPEGLKELNKNLNLRYDYESGFRRINRHGIAVIAHFMLGLDADTPEKLEKKIDFLLHTGINTIGAQPLTPYPGTKIFERMQKENRLLYTNFPADWEHYDVTEIVYRPKNMTPEEFLGQLAEIARRAFSLRAIWIRFFRTCLRTRSLTASVWSLVPSLDLRRLIFRLLRSGQYLMARNGSRRV